MRLITFDDEARAKPGALVDAGVVDLSLLAASVEDLIAAGPAAWDRARDLAARGTPVEAGALLAPLKPASLRDFLAFEDHAKGGAQRRGEELNPAWYKTPVYYKGNHRSIVGPNEDVVWPTFTQKLDFELELACVVGVDAGIFGYTIMNDWSARDVQRDEMAMRLGPAKSKDFATSLGPCIVTADEIDPQKGLAMRARVNGEEWCAADSADMHWTFPQMIAYVSDAEEVFPGDVYGSGTPFGGCGLDHDRWLQDGDVVELEVDGIGVLRNRVKRNA